MAAPLYMSSRSGCKLYQANCNGLTELSDSSMHALVTDPPYGIGYQAHQWDQSLPDPQIWEDCFRVLKPGAHGLIFSSVRFMHRLMVQLEDSGFMIKDVLMWAYLNGMPKTKDVGLAIDKILKIPSKPVGTYKYIQGYKKGGANHYYARQAKKRYTAASEEGMQYSGWGNGVKPCYEPVVLIRKPREQGLSVAENVLLHGTGAINLEETRLPLDNHETGVGHNPHPAGRVSGNILRTDALGDDYDKFFLIPKVRQHADSYNHHPTKKPVELMQHLVKLVSAEGHTVLDPFMGSGSTGIACRQLNRKFIGYEKDPGYFKIACRRIDG